MRLQKVTLKFPGEMESVYIDIANSEEADDSLAMLTQHKEEGDQGTLSFGYFVVDTTYNE